MVIELLINEEKKTFVLPFIKARALRNAIELTERMNFVELKAAEVDELIQYVCDVYGNKFTIDDVWDGIEANKLLPTITQTIQHITGTMGES